MVIVKCKKHHVRMSSCIDETREGVDLLGQLMHVGLGVRKQQTNKSWQQPARPDHCQPPQLPDLGSADCQYLLAKPDQHRKV